MDSGVLYRPVNMWVGTAKIGEVDKRLKTTVSSTVVGL